jgi:hypothetical protein
LLGGFHLRLDLAQPFLGRGQRLLLLLALARQVAFQRLDFLLGSLLGFGGERRRILQPALRLADLLLEAVSGCTRLSTHYVPIYYCSAKTAR